VPEEPMIKDMVVSIVDTARITGYSQVSVSKWAGEDPDSPFKKVSRGSFGSRFEAPLVDVVRWLVKRAKKEASGITLPNENDRNIDLVEQNLWKIAMGTGDAAVKANNTLRNMLEQRGDGLPPSMVVRLAILDTDDNGYPEETDEIIDSVHNPKPKKVAKTTKKKTTKKKTTKKKTTKKKVSAKE